MQVYGGTKKFWSWDDYRNGDRYLKRVLHKKGRSQGRKQMKEQLNDYI